MQTLLQDLKYGVRMLAKSPGFTIIAVLTLALGIGANTAIFSVINATLLARLPYSYPDRIVMVWEHQPSRGFPHNSVSPGNFLHWQEANTVFEQMAGFVDIRADLTGTGEPVQIPGQAVTPSLFPLLGINARIGRTFVTEEGSPGNDGVVVLSDGLWRRRFGSAPDIVGKKIMLGGKSTVVAGVMPPGFQLLIQRGGFIAEHAQFWSPIAFKPEDRTPIGRYLMVVARLKQGVALAQAQSQMDSIAARSGETISGVRHGLGHPAYRASRSILRFDSAGAAGSARSGGIRAFDRVCERCQSPHRASGATKTRVGHSIHDGREPRSPRAPTAHRNDDPRCSRRLLRRASRLLGNRFAADFKPAGTD